MAADPGSADDSGWYQEFTLQFEDGAREQLFLHVSRSGRHTPVQPREPAAWTKLDFHKCPGCPLSEAARYCPAALSLENTLLKLKGRASYEDVKAMAVDGGRRTVGVTWPLQQVGAIFVQLAVFASGCPVGDRVRPYLKDLRAFATTAELTRHVIGKLLLRHRGAVDAVQKEVAALLDPLRTVFAHLLERLRAQAEGQHGDAVINSVVNVDAFAQYLALQSEELGKNAAAEFGWTPQPRPRAPEAGFWNRIKSALFGSPRRVSPPPDAPIPAPKG